jgi:hypothetical protein
LLEGAKISLWEHFPKEIVEFINKMNEGAWKSYQFRFEPSYLNYSNLKKVPLC